jgi:cobalt transporter subunit CbtB
MNTQAQSAASARATTSTPWPALAGAAALALVVLYGVAFADSPFAHDAAHDVRHVTVKPCH